MMKRAVLDSLGWQGPTHHRQQAPFYFFIFSLLLASFRKYFWLLQLVNREGAFASRGKDQSLWLLLFSRAPSTIDSASVLVCAAPCGCIIAGCGGGAELSAVISIAIIPALPTHLDPGSCCCAQLSICYLTQHTYTKVQPIPAYTLLLSLSELQFHIYSGTPVRIIIIE